MKHSIQDYSKFINGHYFRFISKMYKYSIQFIDPGFMTALGKYFGHKMD